MDTQPDRRTIERALDRSRDGALSAEIARIAVTSPWLFPAAERNVWQRGDRGRTPKR